MKRISAGGARGVRVRERGAGGGALSAMPRLQLELTASPGTPFAALPLLPPSCTPRAWGKVKIGRTIGVGTSVVQRVLGVNSRDRSLRVGAGRSGPRLPNTD